MGDKRMFSKVITESDAFLDLPLSTQALYFHLAMQADDDGFVSSPSKTIRMVGASKNEYDLLLAKKFILVFEDGIIVIKHWLMHNCIRKDRYKPTVYIKQKETLYLKENNAYTTDFTKGTPVRLSLGIPDDNQETPDVIPVVGVDKVSIDKVKLNKKDISMKSEFDLIRKEFKGTKTIKVATDKLPKLIALYSFEQILNTVKRYNADVDKKRKTQPNLSYMNESTFWNGRYMDYLDENYINQEVKQQLIERRQFVYQENLGG
jgi:hypothetical protein